MAYYEQLIQIQKQTRQQLQVNLKKASANKPGKTIINDNRAAAYLQQEQRPGL